MLESTIVIPLAITAAVLFLLYKTIIKPQIAIRFYTNQGMPQKFFAPLLGFIYYLLRDMNGKQKDALYSLKKLPEELKGKKCDAFVSNVATKPLIHLLDPTLIGEFLQKQAEVYKKTDMATAMSKLLFGTGIIFAEGEEWKGKRKLLSSIFHYKLIEDQVKLVLSVCERTFAQQDLKAVCFVNMVEKIGGDVGLMSFLGADVNKYTLFGQEPNAGINSFMQDFMKYSFSPLTIFAGEYLQRNQIRASDKEILKKIKEIKSLIRQIIVDSINQTKDRIKNKKDEEQLQTTIISLLLEKGQLLNDEEIDELITITINFYFAAKDTVSRVLANLFYFIGKNQHIYDQLEKEVLSHADEEITLENMKKYTYLEATIKESLRCGGPTPFLIQRTALVDHTLGGYKIKKDTDVNCNFIYNYYNEEYFANPMEFNPSRWLDPKQLENIRMNPFSYLPFSGGARNCIGQYFAMMEMKAILIHFIRSYEQFQIPEDFVYHIVVKTTIETKNHLTCSLTKRKQKQNNN